MEYEVYIECPKCGDYAEVDVGTMLMSDPPRYNWRCGHCGRTGYIFCHDVGKYQKLRKNDDIAKLRSIMMTDEEKRELHTETILNHISVVRDLCHKMGIPELGDTHDLSKFYPDEFGIYKWADGKRSPHDNARDELGYSPSWYLHYHRNPHHWQHFIDVVDATPNEDGTFTIKCKAIKMPYDRVIEMFCDQWGASKTYNKKTFSLKAPLEYYKNKCEGQRAMHPASEALLKRLLNRLADSESEEDFIIWYNNNKETLQKNY